MPAAIAGASVSTPPAMSRAGGRPQWTLGAPLRTDSGGSFVRLVSPDEITAQQRQKEEQDAAARQRTPVVADLGAYIRQRWMAFRNHRNQGNNQINDRLLRAQRMFEGKYDPNKLAAIKQFGGSEVYSRLVAVKSRGATSLLRDVYLGAMRPWDIEPQPDPPVPPEVQANIIQLIAGEAANLQQSGQPVLSDQIHMRYTGLMHAAQQASRRNALMQSAAAADKVEDILREGGLYEALAEFLVDLTLFPYAVLKGPVVRMVPKLTWSGRTPIMRNVAQMFWERVDPFHFYWSPGVQKITDAEVLERKRLTRADLNDLLGLPGYDQEAVRATLQDYSNGLRDWLDWTDTEAALNEARESPYLNTTHMIDAIEYHGNMYGRTLLEYGVDPRLVPDPDRDYQVQSWVVGRHTLKTQLNPSPRQRMPYYITSFEKVPGTVIGHGLPDILEDLQEICNATLRTLVNNMGMASGPQVVVRTDMLDEVENEDSMYPWKRWRVNGDGIGAASGQKPIEFFQPNSNAQEMLAVYTAVSNMADDISAIPRYISGESLSGGAGRTASGLSMLMNNSSKILQTVAANIDRDVLEPLLRELYDMIMLTDQTGLLAGDEQITVNGVTVAVQKETERQKQLQFLQITANPIDAPIIGELGRARLLRPVAQGLGLPDDIVPDDYTLEQKMKAEQAVATLQAQAGIHPGQQPGGQAPGAPSSPGARAAGAQSRTTAPARHADNAPPFNAFQQGVQTNV